MARIPEFDPIAFLTYRKFGRTSAPEDVWFPVSLSEERLARKAPDLAVQIETFQAELSRLSPTELSARVAEESKKQQAELTAKAEAEERDRFFNQPGSTADFDYWSRLAHWTLDEALALSLGKAARMGQLGNCEVLCAGFQICDPVPASPRIDLAGCHMEAAL
jgi:hypothetical protein